jgi:hypothetical protein
LVTLTERGRGRSPQPPSIESGIEELRKAGIRVLFGPGEFVPYPLRTGETVLDTYPWVLALQAAN